MSWIQQNANFYIHSDAPFSLQYIGTAWYLVDNRDQSKAIPFSDIFNNPSFPIDLSSADVLVKSLTSSTTVSAGTVLSGTHLRGEAANTPSTPAHSFKTEISSGFYRESPGVMAFSSLGTKVSRIDSLGVQNGTLGTDLRNILQTVQGQADQVYSTSWTQTANTNYWLIQQGSITPKSSSSKIIITGQVNCYVNSVVGLTQYFYLAYRTSSYGSVRTDFGATIPSTVSAGFIGSLISAGTYAPFVSIPFMSVLTELTAGQTYYIGLFSKLSSGSAMTFSYNNFITQIMFQEIL